MYQTPQYNGIPNYYQQPQRQAAPVNGLRGYPVSSLEEARAAVVDFDGSVFVFPDLANKRIYTKQINLDGTATLSMYEKTELPIPTAAEATNYVSKPDFDTAVQELKDLIAALGQANSQTIAPAVKVTQSF